MVTRKLETNDEWIVQPVHIYRIDKVAGNDYHSHRFNCNIIVNVRVHQLDCFTSVRQSALNCDVKKEPTDCDL